MGSEPALLNPVAEAINKALRLSFDLVAKGIKAALMVEAPYLGWPVISQVVDFLIGKLSDQFYKFFSTNSTIFIINFQTVAERNAYIEAIERLKSAIGSGDKGAEDEARQKAKDALGRLIHWVVTPMP